jgi:hypothetical protein
MRLDEVCMCDDRVYPALPLLFKQFIAFVCPNCKCLVTYHQGDEWQANRSSFESETGSAISSTRTDDQPSSSTSGQQPTKTTREDEQYLVGALVTNRPVNVAGMLAAGFLEPWQPDPRVGEFVYIAQSELTGLVKIGYTANPRERMRQLNCKLLGLLRGDRRLERELHVRFEQAAHARSEWFSPDEELLQLAQENQELALLFEEEPLNGAKNGARTSEGDTRTQNREEKKRKEKEQVVVREVYDHWRKQRAKTHGRYDTLTDNRRRKIVARLREFSADELKRAIDAVALDPWEERSRHDDLTILFRSEEQVQKFLSLEDDPSLLSTEERLRRHFANLEERA